MGKDYMESESKCPNIYRHRKYDEICAYYRFMSFVILEVLHRVEEETNW